MANALKGIGDDQDLGAALGWFHQIDSTRGGLAKRIISAQEFFRAHAAEGELQWPEPTDLLMKTDLIASYLAQADAFLHEPRSYDLTLAAHIVPFIKHIGMGLGALRRMPGVVDRVRRLLNPKQEHPDGALYEWWRRSGMRTKNLMSSSSRNPPVAPLIFGWGPPIARRNCTVGIASRRSRSTHGRATSAHCWHASIGSLKWRRWELRTLECTPSVIRYPPISDAQGIMRPYVDFVPIRN